MKGLGRGKEKGLRWLETLLIALCGGTLFQLLHIPLSWMLGPLTAVMLWSIFTKRPLYWPLGFRQTGLAMLGYLLGTSFTRETAWQILWQLPAMIITTLLVLLFSLMIGAVVARLAGVDVYSSIFGSVPGGLSQMVAMSEEIEDVDATVVTFMQMIRVMTVIFVVPFLTVYGIAASNAVPAGSSITQINLGGTANTAMPPSHAGLGISDWFSYPIVASGAIGGIVLAMRLRMATPFLIGPMLATAILMLTGLPAPNLPPFLIILSQFFIGTHMGLQMRPGNLPDWKKLTLFTWLGSLLLVFFCLLLALLLTWRHPFLSLASAYLGMAPGGIAEMGVTAIGVGADLSIVSAYQLFRLFVILFAVPPLLQWWMKRQHAQGHQVH